MVDFHREYHGELITRPPISDCLVHVPRWDRKHRNNNTRMAYFAGRSWRLRLLVEIRRRSKDNRILALS